MKECIKCSTSKEITDFPKSGNICKACKKVYLQKYYQENRDKIINLEKDKYYKNREDKIKKQKEYTNLRKDEVSKYLKEYRKIKKDELSEKRKLYDEKNKERINEKRRQRYKERIKTDLDFKLKKIHRNLLKRVLRYKKHEKTSILLGYTSLELKENIESKFKDGMCWDNYGKWEIDHIIPVSHFDLQNTHPSVVNSLDNLQPLWKHENIIKSNYVQK